MSVMISAIGVSYLLQNLALYVTGGLAQQYPSIPWISDTITVLGASTKRVTVITPFLTIILVVVLGCTDQVHKNWYGNARSIQGF